MDKVVDITDLVEKMRDAFVDYASAAAYVAALAIPGLGPILAMPFVNYIAKQTIRGVVFLVSQLPMMAAFFLNTAIRKTSQAKDFIVSVHELENLPEDVSDEVYLQAEEKKASNFYNFVVMGN